MHTNFLDYFRIGNNKHLCYLTVYRWVSHTLSLNKHVWVPLMCQALWLALEILIKKHVIPNLTEPYSRRRPKTVRYNRPWYKAQCFNCVKKDTKCYKSSEKERPFLPGKKEWGKSLWRWIRVVLKEGSDLDEWRRGDVQQHILCGKNDISISTKVGRYKRFKSGGE